MIRGQLENIYTVWPLNKANLCIGAQTSTTGNVLLCIFLRSFCDSIETPESYMHCSIHVVVL